MLKHALQITLLWSLLILASVLQSSQPSLALAQLPQELASTYATEAPTPTPWSRYTDPRWGYSIHYPATWKQRVVFTNGEDRPLRVIRKRVDFSSPQGAGITVDVWQKDARMGFMAWVEQYQGRLLELGGVELPSGSNAIIAGQEALVLSQVGSCSSPPLAYAYIDGGDRVILVQYVAWDRGEALDLYRQMLHSLSLESLTVPLKSGSDTIPPFSLSSALYTCDYAPNADGCCGYPQVARWSCSIDTNTLEHRGNCTYWAAYMRPDIGEVVSGNAGQWAVRAEDAGYDVDGTPRAGDIMVVESDPGHVAYVTGVNGNTISVTEMSWCTTCPERSWSYPASGKRFIHDLASPCPAPTNGLPRYGEAFGSRTITFTWDPPSCAGLDYYTFRVADHSDIDNPPWIIDRSVSAGARSTTEDIPAEYERKVLYWAIRAHNSAGAGARGGPWSFWVDTRTDPCPDGDAGNDFDSATAVDLPVDQYEYICPGADHDWYRFYISSGETIQVALSSLPADYDMHLYRPNGSRATSSLRSETMDEDINYTADASGEWRLEVYGFNGANNPTAPYYLHIEKSIFAPTAYQFLPLITKAR